MVFFPKVRLSDYKCYVIIYVKRRGFSGIWWEKNGLKPLGIADVNLG